MTFRQCEQLLTFNQSSVIDYMSDHTTVRSPRFVECLKFMLPLRPFCHKKNPPCEFYNIPVGLIFHRSSVKGENQASELSTVM